ncbi:hypothetical protein X975_02461, partial [Stegodyphus mimosarum]
MCIEFLICAKFKLCDNKSDTVQLRNFYLCMNELSMEQTQVV